MTVASTTALLTTVVGDLGGMLVDVLTVILPVAIALMGLAFGWRFLRSKIGGTRIS